MSETTITFSIVTPAADTHAAKKQNGLIFTPVFAAGTGGKKLAHSLTAHQADLESFTAEAGQTLLTFAPGKTFLHLGLGASEKLTLDIWRKALIGGFKKVHDFKTTSATFSLTRDVYRALKKSGASDYEIGRATATIISLVLYEAKHYKTEAGGFKATARISEVKFLTPTLAEKALTSLKAGLSDGATLGAAVNFARDTANEPPNVCTPTHMVNLAEDIVEASEGTMTLQVFGREDCDELGMKAFTAVARGAHEEPKFIVMDYHPKGVSADAPVLGLVGKSITFDAGGLDIKPADGMRDMKYDMCGGADVLAVMRTIAALGLPVHVKAFMAATENMTGGSAYKPGDVYVSLDGKSYEIDNTDAEGRLTLVDAIAYARIHGGVSKIIDYATLTGAVLVALGDTAAGVVTNNQEWADVYLQAAKTAGEKVHQFPVYDEYKEQNKSDIADLKNTGGRLAGSITAGLFVLSAAGDVPCVHVDIAGTSFRSRPVGVDPKGGTGFGVMTLVALVEELAKGW